MTVEEVHNRINELCEEYGWTAYKLAKESGIPQSTYYNTISRNTIPKLETIEKICEGFDITLSEFFRKDGDETIELSEDQKMLLERYKRLDKNQRLLLTGYMDALERMND